MLLPREPRVHRCPPLSNATRYSFAPWWQHPPGIQGKEALKWRLRRLNLPPEEWANDVKDIYAQLVEALEQIRVREEELDEHEQLVAR